MKKILLSIISICILSLGYSQEVPTLETVYVNENVSTHFTSQDKIDYTDLSTASVTGDLPMENILRIKPTNTQGNMGYITIVGEHFFYQFKLVYTPLPSSAHKRINLDAANPLGTESASTPDYTNPNYSLTTTQLKKYSAEMLKEKSNINNVIAKGYHFTIKLNNIWIKDDFLFIDYTAKNKTNIPYSIDEIRYKIIDQRLVKSQNSQDQLITPIYSSNPNKNFDKTFRNVVAIKKFTYPQDKSFIIHMAEDQISGRNVTLHINYKDLLKAKRFNHI